ncbi:MAG TPA: hypothetical protein PLJ27_11190 [Polyangiaceae bacterium]|nr:MAG: hypothetical protein BWY17_02102 [Deltaproteobacteria bacterium ADurb.Bin207]HNS96021.1 hypothetical protein [Polyangiaceae bacterium]HNZ22340.1 hypothetical protein [Polyangiaceae bacterium]HOD20874.1 hypothetical protein [Polyangiaceae bacterium]HOE49088.1 hypothetical protein [Polyangiaceae bacterium]
MKGEAGQKLGIRIRKEVRLSRRQALAWFAGMAVGCRRRDVDETPEGVVQEWLERMARVHGDPRDAQQAYELLSSETKSNLQERARRASAATGRKMEPESMLAPSRFSLRFTPRRMRSRVAGDRALVEVVGSDPELERAEVPCVLEQGKWRVDLVLPPLPAVEKRPDAGG